MKILALSPHPDDAEIGAGGFLLSAIDKGAEVHVVYCLHEKIVAVENNAKQFNYSFSWLKDPTSNGTQKEHMEIAHACAKVIKEVFPQIQNYTNQN